MRVTDKVKQHLAAGSANPRELFQRMELDPEARSILSGREEPVQTIASILHHADIRRNKRGWCSSDENRPRRYTLVQPNSGTSPADIHLASLIQPVTSFFDAQQIRTHLLQNTSPDTARFLPDIIGLQRLHREGHSLPMDYAFGAVTHRIVACVVTTELNSENLYTMLLGAAVRTRCAHIGYIAAAKISTEPAFMNLVDQLSQTLRIGVIQINTNSANSSIISKPVQPETNPDLRLLAFLKDIQPPLRLFLATSTASMLGEYLSHCVYAPALPASDLGGVQNLLGTCSSA
jgi:hypothetical protein